MYLPGLISRCRLPFFSPIPAFWHRLDFFSSASIRADAFPVHIQNIPSWAVVEQQEQKPFAVVHVMLIFHQTSPLWPELPGWNFWHGSKGAAYVAWSERKASSERTTIGFMCTYQTKSRYRHRRTDACLSNADAADVCAVHWRRCLVQHLARCFTEWNLLT